MMEYLHNTPAAPVAAVLFDFDGTISTLRFGWEKVMRALMLEWIADGHAPDEALERLVDEYLNESAGIQTIFQMKWVAAQVREHNPASTLPDDPWWYKEQYNIRLMQTVAARVERIASGAEPRECYLMRGALDFLEALRAWHIPCYVASGTDDADVRREAGVLGVAEYFTRIAGAPVHAEGCAKEAALRSLVEESGVPNNRIAVIGDGKVEIALARAIGARALGMATDEANLGGRINAQKCRRLKRADADAIAADFTEQQELLQWLGLEA